MKSKIIYILSLVIFIYSCKKEDNSIKLLKNKSISNVIVKTNSFSNNGNYNGVGKRKTFIDSLNTYLFTLSTMQQRLEVFNVEKGKMDFFINFRDVDELTKNQITIDNYYIHNLDSIFLFSYPTHKLVLINLKTDIEKIWDLKPSLKRFQSENFLEVNPSGGNIMFFDSKKKLMYFKSHSPFNLDEDYRYYERNNMSVFDLVNSEFIRTIGEYPKNYSNKKEFILNGFNFEVIPFFDKGKYIVSHNASHFINEYEIESDKLINAHDAKSNFLDEFDFIPRSSKSQEKMNQLITQGKYKNIFYNKFTKKYYRLATHNQSLKNIANGKNNNATFGRSFSVIVLNDNFKKQGEYSFINPKNFTFFNLSMHKKGILILYRDPTNENVFKSEIHEI